MKENCSILIFTDQIPARVELVFGHIFKKILQLDFLITSEQEKFAAYDGPKINYSWIDIKSDITLFPHTIFSSFSENDFLNSIQSGDFISDEVFTCFLLLTEIEEYLPHQRDKWGRLLHKNSSIFKKIDVKKPFVDQFAWKIYKELKIRFSRIPVRFSEFSKSLTVDFDLPFYQKFHPLKSQVKKLLRAFVDGKFTEFFQRLRLSFGIGNDPYETAIAESHNIDHIFIPVAQSSYPNNFLSLSNKRLQEILSYMNCSKGIHLSTLHTNNGDAHKEVEIYSKYLEKPLSNRFHFIKKNLPFSYEILYQNGIKEDFSLGFPDMIGFKAGTSYPVSAFHPFKNEKIGVELQPFQVMDVTLKNYMKLKPKEAIYEIVRIEKEISTYGGKLISILHHPSLCSLGEWKGWETVWEELS